MFTDDAGKHNSGIPNLYDAVVTPDTPSHKDVSQPLECIGGHDPYALDCFVNTLAELLIKYQSHLDFSHESGDAETISAFVYLIYQIRCYIRRRFIALYGTAKGLCLYPCFYGNAG